MERLVRGRAPRRDFDEQFWQALGPGRILEAAWDLVVTAASAKGIHEDQLRLPDVFYPIGMEPGSLPTWNFESAWERRVVVDFDGEPAGVLSRDDSLLSKKAAGRPRDRRHIRRVQKPRKSR